MALTEGLISYWSFNEQSANANDIISGFTLTNTGVGRDAGIINNCAVNLTTATSGMIYSGIPTIPLGSNWTMNGWFNLTSQPPANTPFMIFFQRTNAQPNHVTLDYRDASGVKRFVMGVGTDTTFNYTETTGVWLMYTLTYDGTNFYFYRNGNFMFQKAKGGNDSQSNMGFGCWPDNTRSWVGKYDECANWNRVLSTDEMKQLYNGGNGLPYPFAEGSFLLGLV